MELKISIVTCSDTRDLAQDEAGAALEELIEAQGWTAVDTAKLAEVVPEMELIFNTVPAPVLTNDAMRALLPPCIVIDLASLPGGVAPDAEPAAGCRVLHALSLPGKVAPRSAAEAIYMTVTAILREEGLL